MILGLPRSDEPRVGGSQTHTTVSGSEHIQTRGTCLFQNLKRHLGRYVATDRAVPAFPDRVHHRGVEIGGHDADTGRVEHGVEAAGEPRAVLADQLCTLQAHDQCG